MILLLAAIAYTLLFWTVTWRRPQLALASIFALAPFQNDLSVGGPVRFSIAELNLLLALPVFMLQRRPVSLGPLAFPVVAYIAICFVSSVSDLRTTALTSFIQIILYIGVVVVVFRGFPRYREQYRTALIGLVVVCVFLASVVLVKHSGYVLGLHKNGSGGSLACGMIVCTELWFAERNALRKKWLLGAMLLIGAGLIFTLSRGAWMTTATGLAIILALRGRFLAMLRAGLVLVPLVVLCWSYLPEKSKDYATDFDQKNNFNIRLRYAAIDHLTEKFQQNPVLGVGVGLRKEYDATNVILLTLAETGVPGLAALLSIHLAFLWMAWKGQRGLARSSLDYSLIAIAAALVVGKMMHGVVDHYWGRGDTMIVWASAGMAVRACGARRGRAPQRFQWPALDETPPVAAENRLQKIHS